MEKNKWKIITLAALISFSTIGQTYATTVNDLKKEQTNINKKIDETKENIKVLQNKTKDVSKEIDDLDKKVDKATIELRDVEAQLNKLNKDIEIKESELNIAENNLSDQDESFKKRLRAMYINGNAGYLEVLLSSKDVKDFLSKQDLIQMVAQSDRELLEYMKEQRDVVENKKTELEAKRASVETTKSEIKTRQDNFNKITREKEALMSKLKEDIVAYEKEYDKLNDLAKSIEKKIINLQSKNTVYSGGVMAFPTPGYSRITSQFGYRIHPIFKVKKLHTGIDIGLPTGSKIIAASDGKVIYSDWLGGYGKTIMIDHGGGVATLYAHNSELTVGVGKQVKKGDQIAKAGSTGNSTGPHLHFEVRKNGVYVDPLPWVKGK